MGHDHGQIDVNQRCVRTALGLTAAFMLAEVVGGWLSGSLALLADAGHMLTDAAALALAWIGFWLAKRPPDERRTYGYRRFEVMAGWINGISLLAIAAWIVYEAVRRLSAPHSIDSTLMLIVAVIGLGVNIAVFRILYGGDRRNINVQGALLHVLGDMLGSLVAIVAAIVIATTGWTPIDAILSMVVAVLLALSAWRLVRKSTHILLEGTPDDLDIAVIRREITESVAGVEDVHHFHAWSLTTDEHMVTFHVRVAPDAPHADTLTAIKDYLRDAHGITHSVIQIESETCPEGVSNHP
jgi:cobalt-zinc-cadmium efflux system protein